MNTAPHAPSAPPRSHSWFYWLIGGVTFTAIGLWYWPDIRDQVGTCRWDFFGHGNDLTATAWRDALAVKLSQDQAALARYEAEHREWATETIEKMKTVVETLPIEVVVLARSQGNQKIDDLITEREKELNPLMQEMDARLDAIKKKSAEIEATKKQLGEIETKLGLKPSVAE